MALPATFTLSAAIGAQIMSRPGVLLTRLTAAHEAAAMDVLSHTIKRHWNGILRWFHSKIANGLIEGINSLVQAAKAKARGYRSIRNLNAIVYLLAGKLDIKPAA